MATRYKIITTAKIASGAEVTTGTDNEKYITPKALADAGVGTSTTVQVSVAQNTHGFSVGDVIKSAGTANAFAKAQADSSANSEVVGIVSVVTDTNNFKYVSHGYLTTGVPTATAGTVYYLSPTSAGAMTATEPTTVGQVSKPVLVVLESAAKAQFINFRGMEITTQSAATKSTGAEINTGTNDVNWATPKAIADSYLSNEYYGKDRQALINGGFDVWQRGTSFTAQGNTADRWTMLLTGNTATASRQAFTVGQTDVPGEPAYYMRIANTTSAGASNRTTIIQRVEDVRSFAGQTATLSFYAKVDAAKNISIEFGQEFGSGGSPSTNITTIGVVKKAITTSWAKYTASVTFPSISGKTLGTDINSTAIWAMIWVDAGSDYDARTDTLGQQSGTFEFANMQFNLGSVALPFCKKSPAEELRDCQRYYERITKVTTDSPYGAGVCTETTTAQCVIHYKETKRKIPTVSTSSTVGDFEIRDGTGSIAVSGFGTQIPDLDSCYFLVTAASGLTKNSGCIIRSNSANETFIAFDAEF